MMMFIDHVPTFMSTIPIPLNRFSTEGGEHSNYTQNTFVRTHTVNHGTASAHDPHYDMLKHMYNLLSYEITNGPPGPAASFRSDINDMNLIIKIQ